MKIFGECQIVSMPTPHCRTFYTTLYCICRIIAYRNQLKKEIMSKENVWKKLKKCYKKDFSKCKKEYPETYRSVKADMESKEFIEELKVSTFYRFFVFLGKDYRELSIINMYRILK